MELIMNRVKPALLAAIFCLAMPLVAPLHAAAQGIGENKQTDRQLVRMGLYPPDIIMRHQQRLGVTDAQRKKMLALVKTFQSDVAELQWNLQKEQQQMQQTLAETKISQAEALKQIESVLEMESKFKLAHFKLLIGIKNELTGEQIELIKQRVRQVQPK